MDAALRRALLVPTIVTLAAMSVLLGLGTWQWQRKAWKEQVIATITARSKAAPIEAGDWLKRDCPNLDQFGIERSCEYLAVRLTGTFDHANERYVYTGIAKPAGGGVGGQGYWIMTPLRISGSNEVVAVSRGFVPEAQKLPSRRAAGQVAGESTIVGLVREPEPRSMFTGANDPPKGIWYLRNPGELFPAGPLTQTSHFIDLLSPTASGGLPQPTAGRIDIPNRHLEYALTWWGLALTLAGVYVAFVMAQIEAARSR